jgi:hypothetical protein
VLPQYAENVLKTEGLEEQDFITKVVCQTKVEHKIKHNTPPIVATPLWPSVGVKLNTPKVGDLESSGTPECLGFNSKAQNTSH